MGQIISSYVKSSCDIFFWRDFPLIHILKNPPADYWRQNSLEILSLSLFLRKRGIWSFAIRIPSIRDQSLIRGTLSEDVLTSRSSISFPIARICLLGIIIVPFFILMKLLLLRWGWSWSLASATNSFDRQIWVSISVGILRVP